MGGYYNTYSGLGAGFTDMTQAIANKAKQIAQTVTQTVINAKNNQTPNPATATTTATTTAAQAARINPNTVSHVIGSKTVENVPQLVQKAAAVPATTPTVAPSNQPAQPKTWKDYLLWIALGGVVAFGAYKMLTGKKKRR